MSDSTSEQIQTRAATNSSICTLHGRSRLWDKLHHVMEELDGTLISMNAPSGPPQHKRLRSRNGMVAGDFPLLLAEGEFATCPPDSGGFAANLCNGLPNRSAVLHEPGVCEGL